MRRARQISLALASLLAWGALGGCGEESESTFEVEGYPFSFAYPGDFELSTDVTIDQNVGAVAADTAGVFLNESNGVVVQRFPLEVEIDESNIEAVRSEFDGLIRQLDSGAARGEVGEIAGFPSLTYETVAVTEPPEGESRITVLFDGDQEYLINCQSTPDERESIEAACDGVLESLAAV